MRYVIAFLLATAPLAFAEWEVVRQTDEPLALPGAVHRHIELVGSSRNADAAVDLATFSAKSCQLRVIDNAKGAELADVAPHSGCVAAVNGGYFDTRFAPLGLRMDNGLTLAPLKHGRLMSGVAASNGAVQIMRLNEFSSRHKYTAAVECGPFLVDGGRPVAGLESTRSARRTFIGLAGDGRAAIGASSDVTLAQVGQMLAALNFRRALNLDGGSSTAFWCERADGTTISLRESKTVRDFVGVAGK